MKKETKKAHSKELGFFLWNSYKKLKQEKELTCLPCTLQTVQLSACTPGGLPTGAGYSSCSKFLYIAMGSEVNVIRMDDPLKGKATNMNQLLNVGCCKKQKGSGWGGLAVIPAWKKTLVGSSCLASSCGTCNMKLDFGGGDGTLGNPDLTMTISGAPTNSTGAFYLSAGACTSGFVLPGVCGRVYISVTAPNPLFVGIFNLGGSGGTCAGSLNLKVGGVPTNTALCGFTTCTQFLIRCPKGGALSAGLTNGLQFSIGG